MAEALSAEADHAVATLWNRLGPGTGCVVAVGDLGRRMLAPGSRIELLVLHPSAPEASRDVAQAVKAMSFELWSAGIEVSASVHPASDVAELALRHFDLEAAALDGRPVAGDESLWEEARRPVLERARSDVDAFLVRVRRAIAGRRLEIEDATAALEPNLQDGRGGLADVAAIRRIEEVRGLLDPMENTIAGTEAGQPMRWSQLDAAADLLHRARAALHRHAGRGTDLLELGHRKAVAEALFGADAGATSEVTLMRLLYEQCRVVAAILDAMLDPGSTAPAAAARFAEAFETPRTPDPQPLGTSASGTSKRSAPQTSSAAGPGTSETSNTSAPETSNAADPRAPTTTNTSTSTASNASGLGASGTFRPTAPGTAGAGGPDAGGTWSPEAARAFLDILGSGVEGRPALLALDASGVLTRTIPEWAGIRCLPERRSYHRYCVDEHSFRAVAALATLASDPDQRVREAAAILDSKVPGTPRSQDARGHEHAGPATEASGSDGVDGAGTSDQTNENVRRDADTLTLATLLHDVGKGGELDHSERGAELARTIVRRMGFGEEMAADVAWLVRNHLLLAHMATRRDIGDEALMLEVADRVGTERRLHLLYLLTVADGRATSPAAWTLWKATLTGRLYSRVLEALGRDQEAGDDSAERTRARRDEVRQALADLPRGPVESHLEAMPLAWLMSEPAETLAEQSRLMIDFHPADEVHLHAVPLTDPQPAPRSRPADRLWELTVIARDRPGLFSRISGVLALHDLNVLNAEVFTRADGVALEVFRLEALSEEPLRFERVAEDVRRAMRGRISLGLRLAEKRNDLLTGRPTAPAPRVVVDNEASEKFSVIEVHATDRIGLLYTITHAFAELEVDIQLAKVSTYGEEVVDVFYVSDLDGHKLTDPAYISELQALLTYSISGAR